MRKVLNDVIDLYLSSRETRGFAENTRINDDGALRQFMGVIGNVQVMQIGPEHVEAFLAWGKSKQKWAENTQNTKMAALRAFFKWCRGRGLMRPDIDPCGEIRWQASKPRQKVYVPPSRFGELLEAAGQEHPVRRAACAVGLYLFTRQSETCGIKVENVDLDRRTVGVWIKKTQQWDEMPICRELDVELRLWLSYYSSRVALKGHHYLIPARTPGRVRNDGGVPVYVPPPRELELRPEATPVRVCDWVKGPLAALGYQTFREGGHTLRRSGALALYHQLAERGHDRAIRWVQRMLHHKSLTMTERYLDLTVDKKEIHELLAGEYMFDRPAGVVDLAKVREGNA